MGSAKPGQTVLGKKQTEKASESDPGSSVPLLSLLVFLPLLVFMLHWSLQDEISPFLPMLL